MGFQPVHEIKETPTPGVGILRAANQESAETGIASVRGFAYDTNVSVDEIKKAIEHLPLEARLELMQWLNQSADDGWDSQMKRDAKAGKFDKLMREAEADYREGRTTEFP
jgi:hypothetical protein